ncbi:transcobalamin-2 [Pseudophryne corroboree]|uniref:transcobalamin-2 n=1 Tax=Pseudophryne corroboree TaxID=495146 RepID=UPI003081F3EF
MAVSWPVLVILVQAFIVQVKLCEIPEGNTRLIRSLNLKLLRTMLDVHHDANPSVYVGLRLSEDHNLEKEDEYFKRLKTSVETISRSSLNIKEGEPRTGLLALHLLAQKASCEVTDTHVRNRLITHLKYHLHREKENIALHNKPLSSYYQYSLGILAMCVSDKTMDRHVIHKLILAAEHNQLGHGESISIDTEAMAGLALLCVKKRSSYPRELIEEIKREVKNIKEKILASQRPEGQLGNIYSTPLAVQFLSQLIGKKTKESCSKAMSALVEAMKQGKFSNPGMMSQLIPVLHHKSYMDVANVQCGKIENDPLVIPTSTSPPNTDIGEDLIQVRLVVEGQKFNKLFEVHSQSSLLDILKTARKQNSDFSFETKDSLHGPFLMSVNDVKGYWQLLRDPDVSLLEGIADYKPKNGETIILRPGSL